MKQEPFKSQNEEQDQDKAINPVWGFDPNELLSKVVFPNDKDEYKIRHSHTARVLAIRRIPIEQVPDKLTVGNVYIFGPGMQKHKGLTEQQIKEKVTTQIQQDQLARSAACLIIQACFRGWATRKRYVAIINSMISNKTHRDGPLSDNQLPNIYNLVVQEKLRKKYITYCGLFDKAGVVPPPDFPQFCAAKIQSLWKRVVVQRAYIKYILRLQMQDKLTPTTKSIVPTVEGVEQFLNFVSHKAVQDQSIEKCVLIIQRAWKRYYNTRIYLFYRDLIKIRENGDPANMLRYINPREANIIDKSLAIHVRFRLGGTKFPPTIYYKIFVHKNLVDINAFAPRNYTLNECKLLLPKTRFTKAGELPVKKPEDEWYSRIEMNEWRPVLDESFKYTSPRIVPDKPETTKFHYSQLCRKEDLMKRRKEKKLQWMRKLYAIGKEAVEIEKQIQEEKQRKELAKLKGEEIVEEKKETRAKVGWLDLQKGLEIELKKKQVKSINVEHRVTRRRDG
ncbi:hypothetical protein HK103_001185 [Boothiomyces macroporosus]|uniref:Uncharacterized protein n=1 Tax=Boothiomyces macroporosus TaxID=261099 RepID=A0AAD5Y9X4_9FUNG|nr:hypothetical protein HK103_001185 [Boothiomyces macroporosus]